MDVQVENHRQIHRRGQVVTEHVRDDPLDTDAVPFGDLLPTGYRDRGEVHRSHLPTAAGQPDRLPSLAAAQLDRPAG